MSFKRKFEDVLDDTDELGEEQSESEQEFELDEDQEEVEDYGHVRNLGDGLLGDKSPPTKRAKTDLPSKKPDQKPDPDRRVLKLLQEPAIWVNDTPVPLSSNIPGSRVTGSRINPGSSSSSNNFENQENVLNQSNISINFPREDGDTSRLKTESSKLKPQNTLDRSLIEFDTSLLSTSDYFSAEFTRNKKTGRVYRLSSGFDPNKPRWLEDLPDEVIVRIFSYLPKTALSRCARTCKQLQRIAYDESLWKVVDMGAKCLSPGVVGHLLVRGTAVLRLAKSSVAAPIFENISTQFQRSRLQYLDLSMVVTDTDCLEQLMKTCVLLKKLSLENCLVTDKVCKYLSEQNGKSLTTLHMAMVTGLTETGMESIVMLCQNLEELNISWCDLTEDTFDSICHNFTSRLKKLNISGHRNSLQDQHIFNIVEKCPDLVEFDISDCINLTSPALQTISRGLHQLDILSTSRCYNITPSTYLVLKDSSVKYLNIFGSLKESAEKELERYLPKIEINKLLFSSIARPTVGIRRSSIWNIRVRDCVP